MKKSIKLLILSLIISSIAYANTLSLDEALNIYYKKSTTVKNLKLDSEIRKETTKELENELNKNLKVTPPLNLCFSFSISVLATERPISP